MYTLGFNFWKIPFKNNEVLVGDIKNMIKYDIKLDLLFGDCLKRIQSNFVYQICKKLFVSKAKENFIKKS